MSELRCSAGGVGRRWRFDTLTGRISSTFDLVTPPGEILNLHTILVVTGVGIFAVDSDKGAVFKFSSTGAYVNKYGGSEDGGFSIHPLPSQLQWPSSLASDSQG